MRIWIVISALVVASVVGAYVCLNNRSVRVIAVHHNPYTVEILVDNLPLSAMSRITWWKNNRSDILSKSNIIASERGGPDYITVFAFGDGYQEEGKEDRLCFDDVKPQKNCIDKNILMTISRTRQGETRFSFKHAIYIETRQGKIIPADSQTGK